MDTAPRRSSTLLSQNTNMNGSNMADNSNAAQMLRQQSVSRQSHISFNDASNISFSEGALPPDPADVLLDRCRGWRNLVHLLVLQFQEQAAAEKGFLTSTSKTMKHWHTESSLDRDVAFGHEGSTMPAFMTSIRDFASQLGNEHENVHRVLTTQTIPTLQAIDKDISTKMSSMTGDRKNRHKQHMKDEKKLRELVQALTKSIAAHRGTNGAYSVFQTKDPWLVNLQVKKHLHESIGRHTGAHSNSDQIEINYGIWEQNIVSNIKAAILHYTALAETNSVTHASTSYLKQAVEMLDGQAEWNSFHQERLVNAQTPDGPASHYAGADDELCTALKEGPIMRKSKLLRNFQEKWWIMSCSGWLHEFSKRPSLSGTTSVSPKRSFWLRSTTLTPLGGLTDGLPQEFHLVERSDNATGLSTKKKKTHKYSTPNLAESQLWWDLLSDFTGGALTYSRAYDYNERAESRLHPSASRSQSQMSMAERPNSVASTASSFASGVSATSSNGARRNSNYISSPNTAIATPQPVTSTTTTTLRSENVTIPKIINQPATPAVDSEQIDKQLGGHGNGYSTVERLDSLSKAPITTGTTSDLKNRDEPDHVSFGQVDLSQSAGNAAPAAEVQPIAYREPLYAAEPEEVFTPVLPARFAKAPASVTADVPERWDENTLRSRKSLDSERSSLVDSDNLSLKQGRDGDDKVFKSGYMWAGMVAAMWALREGYMAAA